MGIEAELRKPMSYDAITTFNNVTKPTVLDRDATLFDVGYENAKAEIRYMLTQITGVSDVDLTRGIY